MSLGVARWVSAVNGRAADAGVLVRSVGQDRGHGGRNHALVENLDQRYALARIRGLLQPIEEDFIGPLGEDGFQAFAGGVGRLAAGKGLFEQQRHDRCVAHAAQRPQGGKTDLFIRDS